MFNRTGSQFTSKFHSTLAKTISNRPKDFYLPNKQSPFPGPGSYDSFSDFTGYTEIHKKCKCGRFLGHPPIYDDSKCGINYSKTQNYEKENKIESTINKKLNLKIDTDNYYKNDKNKENITNIATTTAN